MNTFETEMIDFVNASSKIADMCEMAASAETTLSTIERTPLDIRRGIALKHWVSVGFYAIFALALVTFIIQKVFLLLSG